jgi:UDP-glucose 4-epimerase
MVTGGAGFIGRHTVEALRCAGHEVAVLDRVPCDYTVNQYGLDVRRRSDVMYAFRDYLPDAVMHLAAQISVPDSFRNPYLDSEINVLGGLNVLESARAYECKRFVFASSGGAIYGDTPNGSSHESDTPRVASPYGASKLAFENIMFAMMRSEMRCVALRYANVYGEHQQSGVVARFLKAARTGETLEVYGDCVRDYVYVVDVARANVVALTHDPYHPIVNISTGVGTRTIELASAIAARCRSLVRYLGPRTGDVSRSVLEPTRMATLGIKARSLASGLREMIGEP